MATSDRILSDPRKTYDERLASRRAAVDQLDQRDGLIANGRLALFVAAAVVAWLAFRHGLPWFWLLVPVAGFVALAVVHDRLLRRRERASRAVAFYERALSRLDGSWAGRGNGGERFDDPDHPYARDLDLFGPGSLFELLCGARTAAGEETLARWLLGPAPAAEVRARQEAVEELRERLSLREDLAVLGADVRASVDPGRLASWGEAKAVLPGNTVRWGAVLLTAASLIALAAWAWLGVGPLPFAALLLAEIVLLRVLRDRLAAATGGLSRAGRELEVLAEVLRRLEGEKVATERLASLHGVIAGAGDRIAALSRRIEALQAASNQFFAPIAAVLLWSVHLSYAVEGWRLRNGPQVRRWLDAVGEIEALSSLASHAFEAPGDPFPTVVDEGPIFRGEALAHPLLAGAIPNDVALGDGVRALVVSGSNMSGKSTLLRTVGVNAVLALAGAPVRARSLVLSVVAIGGTLRVQDSLQKGASRFYAEITRLRGLVAIAEGPLPLLFLIDEVLHGTNSHDRRIGAEAVLRGLLDRGAIGLLTTHDLALAQAAEALAPLAENVHFEDHLENGRLAFDYRMRPGVVRKSNALELMRAVGLDV